jgi:hypothetical protein
MKETTQAELIALAQKHKDNPIVNSILVGIKESQALVTIHLRSVELTSAMLAKAAVFEEGYRVAFDHSDFVDSAAKVSNALSRISILLSTLVSVLIGLGEEVLY